MTELPHAEDVNYWKTGKSTPDRWLEKAEHQIKALGGHVFVSAFGQDPSVGTAAYLVDFEIGGDRFKAVWPVLPTRKEKDLPAAKRQAATLLYRDIKAKCLSAIIKGARRAFFEYLRLPDGQTAGDIANEDLFEIPMILRGFDVLQIEG